METATKPTRRSRASTDPIYTPTGKIRVVEIDNPTPYLVRVVRTMAAYPWLDASWIAAHAAVHRDTLIDRFLIWKAAPNFIVRIADHLLGENWNPRANLIYHLAKNGERIALLKDIPLNNQEWSGEEKHRVMSCKTRASCDLAKGFSITPFPLLRQLALEKLNKRITHTIPTGDTITVKGKTQPETMRLDCDPYIIDGAKRYYLAGIENDRVTEDLSVIGGKARRANKILKNHTFEDYLEFPDLLFAFITLTAGHMKGMQREWRENVEARFHRNAVFKVFKDEPSGWVLSEPWQYADGSPFAFQPRR